MYLLISAAFYRVFIINSGLFYAIIEVWSNPFLDLIVQAITSSLRFHNLYCQPQVFILTRIRAELAGLLAAYNIMKVVGGSSIWMVPFNGSNLAIWKPRMEDFLCCKDLEGPFLGDSAKPKKMYVDEWKILDKKNCRVHSLMDL